MICVHRPLALPTPARTPSHFEHFFRVHVFAVCVWNGDAWRKTFHHIAISLYGRSPSFNHFDLLKLQCWVSVLAGTG